jgi:DNA-binding NtrC family response regulator
LTASILCIDAEPAVGVILEHTLTRAGHRPTLTSSVEDAMRVIARTPVDLIIADYLMPGLTGLDLLAQLDREGYRIPVIIMIGYSSIEHAVMSIESGAIDCLTKPIQAETLEIAVRRALEVVRLRRENETLRREILKLRGRRSMIGESEAFRRVMEVVGTVAASRATVLLQGESGTGKELFARAIHDQSPRADHPFITVDCAALPERLMESALFGHEEETFSGAAVRAAGVFERAHGGTLLLDEVSEMRLDLQSKLLRVIQEQEFERVGGHQPIQVDVRLIATTNRDLGAEVDAGRFRSDLYHHLNFVQIHAPSLRERMDDLPRLVHHFVTRSAELHGGTPPTIAPETLDSLQRYPWPGNVRELANAVERAVILCRGSTLQLADFDRQIRDAAAHPLRPAMVDLTATGAAEATDYNLDAIERMAIERALAATGGNRTRAARLLGISERTLRNKLNTPRAASGG